MSENKLIVIVGPTAVGKTSLSIDIAKYFQTEIISADSRQFYKEMNIGTACPSKDELDAVKHHFIQTLSIQEYYSAYKFREDVLNLLKKLFKTHQSIIMTGGSGLYIHAVTDGIDEIPDIDENIRNEVINIFELQGIQGLRQSVKLLDPEYYNEVDIANPKRLMRAIEISMQTGIPFSSFRKKKYLPSDFKIIKIGLNLNKDELFSRINQRVDQMIEADLLEEAKRLYPFRTMNALNTVGYKELFDFQDKKITLEEAIEKIKQNSRRYAKRQLTWFRKDKEIQWFQPKEKEKIIQYILSL